MKNIIFCLLLILFSTSVLFAQTTENQSNQTELIKVEANAVKGFAYPYYMYVPPALREAKARNQTHTILVIPNNTGKLDDDLSVHEADIKRKMPQIGMIAGNLNVIVLMPVFPRPKTDWKIYTHALDRDAMLTDKKEYKRFDLQLAAMIDNAREKLKGGKIKTDKQILMNGFSASGMFVNRFVFLHPDRVKAAAIGSPGGWAIAPTAVYKEKSLRYPIGISDFKTISGESFDLKKVRKVPLFIFLGDKDDNDSVIFRDSYEDEDEKLVFALFGKTPVERWEISKSLYEQNKLNAEFKLYSDVKHTVTKEMQKDILAFLAKYARQN